MTTTPPDTNVGSFSDPSEAARLRDIINGMIESKVTAMLPTRMTGIVLDIYQGGASFNSDITVESTAIVRTPDNPYQPWVARIRCDDKFEGQIVEARIDPNLLPLYRKAEFFDEDNPTGSGVMVDRAGRYVTVEATDGVSSLLDDTYPSLTENTVLAPQAAPRVAVEGSAASWRVTELLRGVLQSSTYVPTLMSGPDYAKFDVTTLTWAGVITFIRGTVVNTYEITPSAPIVVYGTTDFSVGALDPVTIDLGSRTGSMYVNFNTTDLIPTLIWVEVGAEIPIPSEWYLIFSRVNDGSISTKIIFSSQTDFRQPIAPIVTSAIGVKSGFQKYNLEMAWGAVTEGTNGDPITVMNYEVWGESDGVLRRLTTTDDLSVNNLTFDAGTDWVFSVVAVATNSVRGIFSGLEAISFPAETDTFGTTTYWEATMPTTPPSKEGDEWFDLANGNAHYIHDGALWQPALFGGEAIANAAIGNAHIKDATIESAKIKTIKANKIESEELQATLTLSGIIQTAISGKRVVVDRNGITLYNSLDDPITFINTDGESFFSGVVTATTLTVTGRMELKSANNVINPGADITLLSGIQGPANAPSVSSTWDSVILKNGSGVAVVGEVVSQRASDGRFVSLIRDVDTGLIIFMIHNTDGTWNSNVSPSDYGVGAGHQGLTVLGNYAYTYCDEADMGSTYYFNFYRTNLATGNTVKYVAPITSDWQHPFDFQLNLNNDGTNLVISYNLTVKIFSVTTTSGDNFTSARTATKTSPIDVSNPVLRTQWDYAVDSLLIPYWNGSYWQMRMYTYSSMAEDTNGKFRLATDAVNTIGCGIDGSGVWVCQNGIIYRYNGVKYSGTSLTQNYDFVYSYYDSVGTTHESKPSPSTTFAIRRRAKIRVNASGWVSDTTTVDSINQLRFYGCISGGTKYAQGNNTVGSITLTTLATSGATPLAATTFTGSTPAQINNESGTLVISGDGTIRSVPLAAKMKKTTIGHDSGGGTFSADTLTQVTGFDVTDFNTGPFTLSPSTGRITVDEDGYYAVNFYQRWPTNYGAANNRLGLISTGTAGTSPIAGDGGNGISAQFNTARAEIVYITATTILTVWIQSSASSTFNPTAGYSPAMPMTYFSIIRL